MGRQSYNSDDFLEAVKLASTMYSDVELAFWLNAPQPLLGMFTPVQLLANGSAEKLRNVMRALDEGAYL